MSRESGKGGCLKSFLITLVVSILVIVIAVVVFINLTPRQLKLANVKVGDQTIEEMGIADTKLIQIVKSFRSFSKVEEDKVVTNPYNKEEEKVNIQAAFSSGSLSDTEDYSVLASEKVVYDKQYVVEYNDDTLAYLASNIITNSTDDESALKYMKDSKMDVCEITVTLKDGKGMLRVVSSVFLGEYKSKIEEKLGGLKGLLPIPEKIFIVSDFSFTVNNEGKLIATSEGISINGNNDDPVSKAIISVITSNMGEGASIDDINNKIGEAISAILFNLGQIGSAETNADKEVTGTVSYGMSGVTDHKISVITYTE